VSHCLKKSNKKFWLFFIYKQLLNSTSQMWKWFYAASHDATEDSSTSQGTEQPKEVLERSLSNEDITASHHQTQQVKSSTAATKRNDNDSTSIKETEEPPSSTTTLPDTAENQNSSSQHTTSWWRWYGATAHGPTTSVVQQSSQPQATNTVVEPHSAETIHNQSSWWFWNGTSQVSSPVIQNPGADDGPASSHLDERPPSPQLQNVDGTCSVNVKPDVTKQYTIESTNTPPQGQDVDENAAETEPLLGGSKKDEVHLISRVFNSLCLHFCTSQPPDGYSPPHSPTSSQPRIEESRVVEEHANMPITNTSKSAPSDALKTTSTVSAASPIAIPSKTSDPASTGIISSVPNNSQSKSATIDNPLSVSELEGRKGSWIPFYSRGEVTQSAVSTNRETSQSEELNHKRPKSLNSKDTESQEINNKQSTSSPLKRKSGSSASSPNDTSDSTALKQNEPDITQPRNNKSSRKKPNVILPVYHHVPDQSSSTLLGRALSTVHSLFVSPTVPFYKPIKPNEVDSVAVIGIHGWFPTKLLQKGASDFSTPNIILMSFSHWRTYRYLSKIL
jgi:hypothetical protein